MVELTLPKNSQIKKGRHFPAPAGAKTVKTFRVYRYEPEGTENPCWDTYDVDVDACGPQPRDESTVRQPVLAGSRVDALHPQAAHVALAVATVAIRVHQGMDQRLARRPDERRTRAATALCLVEQLLVTTVGGDAALDSWHGCFLLVREQPLELRVVDGRDGGHAVVATRAAARLDL